MNIVAFESYFLHLYRFSSLRVQRCEYFAILFPVIHFYSFILLWHIPRSVPFVYLSWLAVFFSIRMSQLLHCNWCLCMCVHQHTCTQLYTQSNAIRLSESFSFIVQIIHFSSLFFFLCHFSTNENKLMTSYMHCRICTSFVNHNPHTALMEQTNCMRNKCVVYCKICTTKYLSFLLVK